MQRSKTDETFQPADLSKFKQTSIFNFLPSSQKRDASSLSVAISKAMGAKDSYTEEHGKRVSIYSERLARRQCLPEEEVEYVRLGGLLHDIGKISFSDQTFQYKNTELPTHLSTEIMAHPIVGRSILEDLNFIGPVLTYVYSHHERLDGTGYPQGLSMDNIPLGAQIVSVADHFDAMTTDRPYQKRMVPQEALSVMTSTGALSPALVESFIEDIKENGVLNS
jgi:putative nucleotidyltransferase with HDIG domain